MAKTPTVSIRFWLENRRIGNLGDALNLSLLRWLGYEPVRTNAVGSVNPGRCLFAVGSLISSPHISRADKPIDVWGSGWRGEQLEQRQLDQLTIHAVRGPRTAAALGFPDVPLGDPALLTPRFHPKPISRSAGPAILFPHVSMRQVPDPASVGCDTVISMRVRQRGNWIGRSLPTPLELVDRIASAGFVLAGALHAAILAQAYGVPWAAWAGSKIDCPAKWVDWAEYLGVDRIHVADRWDGEHWWHRSGCHGKVRPLEPLLDAFPYRANPQSTPPVGGESV